IEIHMPHDNKHSIAANANPDATTYWKTDYVYFDQKTLQTIPVKHHYGKLSEATPADTIMRINYDTHVGGILGLPGKIIMCLFSLVIASLPITGILIWYGRKKKKARS
ncbi:MAG: PepSY domain-containing protein, partial [Bacteroidota bacterium]